MARSGTVQRAVARAGPQVEPGSRSRLSTSAGVPGAIALGGALGALARHGIGQALSGPGRFPWATLVVNVGGSFALGLLLILVLERFPPSLYLRPFAATGFLGVYTTYSTFATDAVLLVRDGRAVAAFAYVLASLVLGLTAAWAGMAAARSRGGG